jgi:hypothetical protein
MNILHPILNRHIVNVLTVTKGLRIFVFNAIIVIHVITKLRVWRSKERM